MLSPHEVAPGYYWTIWWRDTDIHLLHVTGRRGDSIAYEYQIKSHRYQTEDHVGVFLLYVDREATEEDWLCELLTR